MTRSQPALTLENARLHYGHRVIADGLSLDVPHGSITMIVGPNGCGKSTTLKALGGVIPVRSGTVRIDGDLLSDLTPRQLATRVSLLPQNPAAPEGTAVLDLVARGRHPHRHRFARWNDADQRAVDAAMEATGTESLADRPLDELSGGQRQRAWLAMVLAQHTPVILLDEPTAALDLAHQLDVLELCNTLHSRGDRTIVIVMHDLSLAARYATHLIALNNGCLAAAGSPREVLTSELIAGVFNVHAELIPHPHREETLMVPRARIKPRA